MRATSWTSPARLDSRSYGGYETLQLEVRDVAPGGHLVGLRRSEAAPLVTVGAGA